MFQQRNSLGNNLIKTVGKRYLYCQINLVKVELKVEFSGILFYSMTDK